MARPWSSLAESGPSRLLEIDSDGRVLRQVPPQVRQSDAHRDTRLVRRLPNGHYVVGNCHPGPGQPVLVEIEPQTKRAVWQLDGFARFGNSVSNSLLLDEATLR